MCQNIKHRTKRKKERERERKRERERDIDQKWCFSLALQFIAFICDIFVEKKISFTLPDIFKIIRVFFALLLLLLLRYPSLVIRIFFLLIFNTILFTVVVVIVAIVFIIFQYSVNLMSTLLNSDMWKHFYCTFTSADINVGIVKRCSLSEKKRSPRWNKKIKKMKTEQKQNQTVSVTLGSHP